MKIYQNKNLLIITGMIIFFASCNTNNISNATTKTLVVAADTAIVAYQCPMKDQHDTCYTTAGSCPSCGMDLEIK